MRLFLDDPRCRSRFHDWRKIHSIEQRVDSTFSLCRQKKKMASKLVAPKQHKLPEFVCNAIGLNVFNYYSVTIPFDVGGTTISTSIRQRKFKNLQTNPLKEQIDFNDTVRKTTNYVSSLLSWIFSYTYPMQQVNVLNASVAGFYNTIKGTATYYAPNVVQDVQNIWSSLPASLDLILWVTRHLGLIIFLAIMGYFNTYGLVTLYVTGTFRLTTYIVRFIMYVIQSFVCPKGYVIDTSMSKNDVLNRLFFVKNVNPNEKWMIQYYSPFFIDQFKDYFKSNEIYAIILEEYKCLILVTNSTPTVAMQKRIKKALINSSVLQYLILEPNAFKNALYFWENKAFVQGEKDTSYTAATYFQPYKSLFFSKIDSMQTEGRRIEMQTSKEILELPNLENRQQYMVNVQEALEKKGIFPKDPSTTSDNWIVRIIKYWIQKIPFLETVIDIAKRIPSAAFFYILNLIFSNMLVDGVDQPIPEIPEGSYAANSFKTLLGKLGIDISKYSLQDLNLASYFSDFFLGYLSSKYLPEWVITLKGNWDWFKGGSKAWFKDVMKNFGLS